MADNNHSFSAYNKVIAITGVSLATAIILTRLLSSQKENHHQIYKKIPQPQGCYPYVGHLFSLTDDPHRQIAKWHQKLNSPIVNIKMGVQNWISISSAKLAHKIYTNHGAVTSARPHNIFGVHYRNNFGGKGLSFTNGKKWTEARSIASRILSAKSLRKHEGVIKQEADALVDSMLIINDTDGHIDPRNSLRLFTANAILNASMGKRFTSTEDPEFKQISYLISKVLDFFTAGNDMSLYLPILSFMYRFTSIETKMDDFVKNTLNPIITILVTEAKSKDEPNFFKELIQDRDEDKSYIISDIVLASIDSGVSAMSWVVAILCWCPKVQETIYKEISEYKKLKSSLPSFDDRHHLPYLNSVLSECLRWKPTNAAGFPHETTADIVVDDYYIPAKTIMILSMEAMHSDESIFKNAKEFVPDRFINNTKPIYAMVHGKFEERDQYNFGFGRRDCPGTALAEMEMFTATVAIVDRCIIKPNVDSNGKDIYPVLDERIDTGVALDPLPYKIKLAKRSI